MEEMATIPAGSVLRPGIPQGYCANTGFALHHWPIEDIEGGFESTSDASFGHCGCGVAIL